MTATGSFKEQLRAEAARLGLQGVGICSPQDSGRMQMYRDWVRQGLHGEMAYLARADAVARRESLRLTLPSVRSAVVVAQEYFQRDPPGVPEDPARGVIARYARGEDYHHVLKGRLEELLVWIRQAARERSWAKDVRGMAYVDTGPILERELAQRAGLGWFGKNTMIIHPRRGSYFFLGVLLLDLELPPHPPFAADRCGSCCRCIEACPTGALRGRDENGAPVMDARRCISYLTIELKGPIPRDLREPMGNRIFGCDICQEVCPWNVSFAKPAEEPAYQTVGRGNGIRGGHPVPTDGPQLVELMNLSQEEFATRFSGSPIKRAKRRGFLRNVAVALGNWLGAVGDPPIEAVAVLVEALSDEEPLVRGHAAWALGRAGTVAAMFALGKRAAVETDPWVSDEISAALAS